MYQVCGNKIIVIVVKNNNKKPYSQIRILSFHSSESPIQPPSAIRPIEKLFNCQRVGAARSIPMGSNQTPALILWMRGMTCLYMDDCKITLILSDYIMNGFIKFGITFMAATQVDNCTLQIKISAVCVFLEANHHSIITHHITLDKKTLE